MSFRTGEALAVPSLVIKNHPPAPKMTSPKGMVGRGSVGRPWMQDGGPDRSQVIQSWPTAQHCCSFGIKFRCITLLEED
jgi:hypothetical protein